MYMCVCVTEHMCVSQRLTSRSIHLVFFYCLVCSFFSSDLGSVIRTWGHQLVGHGVSGVLLDLPPQYGECSMAHNKHFSSWVIAPVHPFITFSGIYCVFISFFILGTYLIMKLKLNFAYMLKHPQSIVCLIHLLFILCAFGCGRVRLREAVYVPQHLWRGQGTNYASVLSNLAETGDCTLVVGLKIRHL